VVLEKKFFFEARTIRNKKQNEQRTN